MSLPGLLQAGTFLVVLYVAIMAIYCNSFCTLAIPESILKLELTITLFLFRLLAQNLQFLQTEVKVSEYLYLSPLKTQRC